jgi:GNAT superfamily N-acetyltransferase
MIRIVQLEERFAEALERLQHDCFPNLAEHELMTRENFLSHCRVFPEGGFVALDTADGGERVVGLGSGFFTDFDFGCPDHTFQEMIAGGDYTNHDPDGEWYYGGDISVHPDYRGRGLGRRLYDARKDLVRRNRRRGIVAGGALPGYERFKGELTVGEYAERVVDGELTDPTLTFQLKNGFEVRGLLEGYIEDSITGNWATLIVWENPDLGGGPGVAAGSRP